MRLTHYFGIAIIFLASRAFYYLKGVRFDASPLEGYLQFIDVPLLETRFLESLLYWHASPPLLNVIAGVGLMLPEGDAVNFYALVFHLVGCLMLISVFYLVTRLAGSQLLGWMSAGFIALTPSFILYENWLMYTFLACGLLTMSAAVLLKYLDSHSFSWGLLFFTVVSLLALTRSIFHFYWLLLVVVILVVASQMPRRQVVAAAILPLLVVFGWYGKNLYLFDAFTASTLGGLSLNNVTTLTVERAELEPLVEQGELSRFAVISRYRQLGKYLDANPQAPTGIAVLDATRNSNGKVNFNSLAMKLASDAYLQDSLSILTRYPGNYLRAVAAAHQVYFSPASFQPYFSGKNLAAIGPVAEKFDVAVYGAVAASRQPQPHFGYSGGWNVFVNPGYLLLVLSLLVLVYCSGRALMTMASGSWSADNIVVGYIFGCWLLVYFAGSFFELSENNRYRFISEPLFWVLVMVAVVDLLRRLTAVRLSEPVKTSQT